MTPIAIAALAPGRAFRTVCTGRLGTLLSLSPGAASVRYAGTRHVALPNGVEFDTTANRPITISLATLVHPVEDA